MVFKIRFKKRKILNNLINKQLSKLVMVIIKSNFDSLTFNVYVNLKQKRLKK